MNTHQDELDQRRRSSRRTAWILAIVAVLIFSVFMLTGITGRA